MGLSYMGNSFSFLDFFLSCNHAAMSSLQFNLWPVWSSTQSESRGAPGVIPWN
uniref:Uncharacterized protein n=1 Tax=Arundo donax TaxID=35708 RepID=A0A0A9HGY1_ARUDO